MSRKPTMSAERAAQRSARSRARLAAVQALYQMDISGADVDEVVAEFDSSRFGIGGAEAMLDADEKHFADVVRNVVERQIPIDKAIEEGLADAWTLSRLESTARAILRAGVYELLDRADVPGKVVIDEYVDVAQAFFEGEELRFINGALNAVARRVRAAEFGAPAEKTE